METNVLTTTITDSEGYEIRIYAEYTPNGRGGRRFIGYLVDNGRDRIQASAWPQVREIVTRMGGHIAEDEEG